MKDYYGVLDVPEEATSEEVRSAFRRMALKYHPDRNPGNEGTAGIRFKEVNEAYGVLGDVGRRRDYDRVRRGQFSRYDRDVAYPPQEMWASILNDFQKIFSESSLRWDDEFLSHVFFRKNGVFFRGGGLHFYFGPEGKRVFYRARPGSSRGRKENPLANIIRSTLTKIKNLWR